MCIHGTHTVDILIALALRGSWWHSSLSDHSGFIKNDSQPYASADQKGTYYFEFSRPLRTMDPIQQDSQFTIDKSSKFSAAFWYPVDGQPWHGSEKYSISCDWIALDFISGSLGSPRHLTEARGMLPLSYLSHLLSVVALCVSVFIGRRMTTNNRTASFVQMDNL
ncbi:hypothetical protein CASFOL_002613 [Castilleja foliolosa]|uniref:Uncharacterized protein n=1 Tax=Castilleja foliolosa TaxID=1961234 RepID=A0ABD3EF69_9LAMI